MDIDARKHPPRIDWSDERPKITIERETTYTHSEVRKMLDGISADAHRHGLEVVDNLDGTMRLRAALAAQPAEPVEPVGYVYSDLTGDKPIKNAAIQPHVPNGTLLYAAPPAPAAVPLTRMQIVRLWGHRSDGPSNPEIVSFARDVERAHGIAAGDKP